jgi:hypothetical protein
MWRRPSSRQARKTRKNPSLARRTPIRRRIASRRRRRRSSVRRRRKR